MRSAPSNSATWYWAAHSTSNVTFIRLCCSSGGIEAGSIFLDKHWELHLEKAALQLEIHMLAVLLENLGFFFFFSLTLLVVLSFITVIWQRFGYLSPVWHNLSSLPLSAKRFFISGPFPPVAGVGNTFSQVCGFLDWVLKFAQCLYNTGAQKGRIAKMINQSGDLSSLETFIFPGMMNSSRNLYLQLDQVGDNCFSRWLFGLDLCPEASEEGQGVNKPAPRAAPYSMEAGPLGTQTILASAWEVGTHLFFPPKVFAGASCADFIYLFLLLLFFIAL